MRQMIRAGCLLACLCVWPAAVESQVLVHTVTLTTDSSGDVTAYTRPTYGHVLAVRYVPDSSTPLDGGADVTVSDNATGLQVLAVTNMGLVARDFAPRIFTVNTLGAVALYAASGTSVLDAVPVAGAIKVVVASGGNAKVGTLYIYMQGR